MEAHDRIRQLQSKSDRHRIKLADGILLPNRVEFQTEVGKILKLLKRTIPKDPELLYMACGIVEGFPLVRCIVQHCPGTDLERALVIASENPYAYDTVVYLLSLNVDPNATISPDPYKDATCPIASAMFNGSYEVFQLLMTRGAKVDSRSIQCVCYNDSLTRRRIIDYLEKHGKLMSDTVSSIFDVLCSELDHDDILKYLNKYEISRKDLSEALGRICFAARYPIPQRDNPRMARLLLSRGADPNYGTPETTLLHTAIRSRFSGVCLELLTHGADPNRRDINERSPLQYASHIGYTSAINLLLQYGADPDDCVMHPIMTEFI